MKMIPDTTPISEKMKALHLAIAASVQKGGKYVTLGQIEKAKSLGATDIEIHDTVLIAAAFCMFNRYVDGLGTWVPQDRMFYVIAQKREPKKDTQTIIPLIYEKFLLRWTHSSRAI